MNFKTYAISLLVAMIVGIFGGYRLAPKPVPTQTSNTELVSKDHTVTKTITVKEPDGRVVESKTETKDTATHQKEAVQKPIPLPKNEKKHHVSVEVNPLDHKDWSAGYGYRVAGPVWLQSGYHNKDRSVTVGLGVEF